MINYAPSALIGDFNISEIDVNASIPGAQLVGNDADRIAIIFSASAAGPAGIGLEPLASSANGLQLTNAMPPLTLTYRDHGALVGRAWFGRSAAGVPLHIITVAFRPRQGAD